MASQQTRPLKGVRVLDLSRLYPGAYCTSLLADLGADVVKIEAPRIGDGMRFAMPGSFVPGHVALNRGKRSLSLDLKQPAAADVLRRLAADADVLVESHRPGALEALGLGYDDLAAGNPGLVWCSLTGFGSDGPLAQAPGHDITYLGYSGLLGLLTEAGEVPAVPQATLAVQHGALLATVGILGALAGRARTGTGMRIDAPLAQASMWTIAENVALAARTGGGGWPPFASRAVYRCADGRLVTLAANEQRSWDVLIDALGLPELAGPPIGGDEDAKRVALTERFATMPAAHWLERPGLAGGVGPVNEPGELLDDPQVVARSGATTIDGTDIRILANPLLLRDPSGPVPTTVTAPPPALGEHSTAVLAAAGFTADEIAALLADGVVVQAEGVVQAQAE